MTDPSDTQPPNSAEGGFSVPEQIGVDLFHRLGKLDEQLQRSQDDMMALIDRRLHVVDAEPDEPPSEPTVAEQETQKLRIVDVDAISPSEPEQPPPARHRPAWQLNLITLAVMAVLVVLGMLLIGLF